MSKQSDLISVSQGAAGDPLFIDTANNRVGVGTSSPVAPLHVAGTSRFVSGGATTPAITVTQGYINGDISSANFTIGNFGDGSSEMRVGTRGFTTFFTGAFDNATGTERMRIDASGGLLLGTTSNPNTYRAIFQGKNATTSIAGEAVLNLADGDANGDRSNIRFTTSTDGPLAVISANAVTGGSYPSSVGLLEFGVQNGGATTTAMSITSAGNVGIGTSSPAVRFHVTSSDNYVAGIESSTPFSLLGFKASNTTGTIDDANVAVGATGDALYLRSGGTERARIDASGNLLVGTTDGSTGNKLVTTRTLGFVAGADTPQINFYSSNGFIELVNRDASSAKEFRFYYGASASAFAFLTTTGVWTNASDLRGKENIEEIHYGLETVMALQPRQFKVKSANRNAIGFVAQEVLPVIPEIVHGKEEDQYGLDYGSITAVLVKAIQDQQAIIEALEARITALEA